MRSHLSDANKYPVVIEGLTGGRKTAIMDAVVGISKTMRSRAPEDLRPPGRGHRRRRCHLHCHPLFEGDVYVEGTGYPFDGPNGETPTVPHHGYDNMDAYVYKLNTDRTYG